MQETWVRSLGWEAPLEKGKAAHSRVLAWRIPWTIPMGSQRVRHGRATFTFNSLPNVVNLYLAELYETLYFNLCKVVCVHLERVSEYVALKRKLWGKNCAGEGNHRKWRAKRLLQKAVLESYLKVQRDRHFPGNSDVKESASNAEDTDSVPGSGRTPWSREWLVFLPGEYCEQRRLLESQRVGHY